MTEAAPDQAVADAAPVTAVTARHPRPWASARNATDEQEHDEHDEHERQDARTDEVARAGPHP